MALVRQLQLGAFAAGTVVPIEAVPDPVFAGRMMGDGIAIEPINGVLYAPCDGEVTQLHSARHACVLRASNGARVLLHIGIDTVLLKGEGFRAKVVQGETVRARQPLIEFDLDVLRRNAKPVITILVVENGDEFAIRERRQNGLVAIGNDLLTLIATTVAGEATAPAPGADEAVESASGWAVIHHAGGMHARPCAILANAIKPFAAEVSITLGDRSANARSATAVMGLAIGDGDEVVITAIGKQAGDALEAAIGALETVSVASDDVVPAPVTARPAATLAANQLAGIVASPGLAMGRTARFEIRHAAFAELGRSVVVERQALSSALIAVCADIDRAIVNAERRGQHAQVGIFQAHRVLADDPDLKTAADQAIGAGKSAAFAWQQATAAQCAALIATGNPLFAGRTADLRDLARQVIAKLTGVAAQATVLPAEAIVLAEDLLPSDFPLLLSARAAAIITAGGGPTSHVAILARAHGIPTLVAIGDGFARIAEGCLAIVDADAGILEVDPAPVRISAAQAELARRQQLRSDAIAHAQLPAVTVDGHRVEVAANVAQSTDALEAARLGAEGVGLLRTELQFIDRQLAPSVAEQTTAYQDVVNALPGRPVIIRTLDVGADKKLAYVPQLAEENPALGVRGIRLALAREALLADQLRALLAVRPLATLRIMLPMVTDLDEIIQARDLLDRLAREAGITEHIPLGVMIETPAAALLVDQLASVADFFSIGTNDLTQYTLCMDRTNPALAARVDGLHPAVLRLVARAVESATNAKRWIGVCGALASDPLAVPLLIGLGVSELSVSPAAIPEIKAVVRRLSVAECRAVAADALQLASPAAVREYASKAWTWLRPASF